MAIIAIKHFLFIKDSNNNKMRLILCFCFLIRRPTNSQNPIKCCCVNCYEMWYENKMKSFYSVKSCCILNPRIIMNTALFMILLTWLTIENITKLSLRNSQILQDLHTLVVLVNVIGPHKTWFHWPHSSKA